MRPIPDIRVDSEGELRRNRRDFEKNTACRIAGTKWADRGNDCSALRGRCRLWLLEAAAGIDVQIEDLEAAQDAAGGRVASNFSGLAIESGVLRVAERLKSVSN